MDVQLKELIEKIKSEGVKTGEDQAAEIIRKAEQKAQFIMSEAEARAKITRDKASAEAARFEATGNEALRQASRDIIISTNKKLEKIFGILLQNEIDEVLKGSFLESVIMTVVKNWKDNIKDFSILLPENELIKLESGLRSKIAKEINGQIEIKPLNNVESGFRVSNKEGSAYFDFTGEGISGLLSELLNPRIAALLQEATTGEA